MNRLPPFVGVVKVDSGLLVGVVLSVASQLFIVDVVGSELLATGAEGGPEGPALAVPTPGGAAARCTRDRSSQSARCSARRLAAGGFAACCFSVR